MNKNMLQPYSQYDSNTFQLQLPLDLGTKIDIFDPVVTFREVLKGVNLKKYLAYFSSQKFYIFFFPFT